MVASAIFGLVCNSRVHHGDQMGNAITVGLLILLLFGAITIDSTNIDDQDAGRMPKIGSWWDGFEDCYISNIWDRTVCVVLLLVLIGYAVWQVVKPADPATVYSAPSPRPAVAAVPKHGATKHPVHKVSHGNGHGRRGSH